MQITPVNSNNFNGKIRTSPALKKIIRISDKKSLERFEQVVKNAELVDDGIYYVFREEKNTDRINGYAKTTFSLHKSENSPHFNETLHTISTYIKEDKNQFLKTKNRYKVLDPFTKILEKI